MVMRIKHRSICRAPSLRRMPPARTWRISRQTGFGCCGSLSGGSPARIRRGSDRTERDRGGRIVGVDIQELTKIYDGRVKALGGVSLKAESGVLGLLGPNGSGKTTLMSIMATLL